MVGVYLRLPRLLDEEMHAEGPIAGQIHRFSGKKGIGGIPVGTPGLRGQIGGELLRKVNACTLPGLVKTSGSPPAAQMNSTTWVVVLRSRVPCIRTRPMPSASCKRLATASRV